MTRLEVEPIRKRSENAAFNAEYSSLHTSSEIKVDLISYLHEYRLSSQKFDYELVFSESDGERKVRDVHRREPMSKKAESAILERTYYRKPVTREEAELKGILSLEDQLKEADEGDLVFWASPPGPREQGYGNYGFVYAGEVKKANEDELDLRMTAVRIENPTISQFNRLFSQVAKREEEFEKAEEFLATPVIVKGSRDDVDKEMLNVFGFSEDFSKTLKDKSIIANMDKAIDSVVEIMIQGTTEEKKDALNTLENLVLKLSKADYFESERLFRALDKNGIIGLVKDYGFEPPKALGSCGSTGESNNILSGDSLFGNEWFTCPKCNYHADGPIGNTCPGCGLTKEEFAKTGADVCE